MGTETGVGAAGDAGAGAGEDEAGRAVAAWLEEHLGRVVHLERQPRWRPAWFAEVEGADGRLDLYVRGSREGFGAASPLEREGAVLQVLEAHGVRVPHVHGTIPDPPGLVMDRLPGRPNLATVEDPAERLAILDDYVDVLVAAHGIDPSAFAGAGLVVPESPEELALSMFVQFEERYRRSRRRPEPLLEFGCRWVRGHVPAGRDDPRFVTCDSGQFLFHEGRVSGLIDLEFAYIGDVAHDLGGLRMRNMSEPLGDVGRALRRYEAVTGVPLDRAAIDFHTVQWVLCTPMSLVGMLHRPPPLAELVQYVEWFHQYSLVAVEAIASTSGIALPEVELPEPRRTRQEGLHRALPAVVRSLEAADPVGAFRRDATAAVADYLRMADRSGAAVDAADLDDLAELLGRRPATWEEGDAALEAFVAASGPDDEEGLVRLFHRRTMRQLRLLEPLLTTGGIAHLTPLDELLDGPTGATSPGVSGPSA